MTITAQEVVRHAAPIAVLLGITKLAVAYEPFVKIQTTGGCKELLMPNDAVALLLGLIVAKCNHLFSYPSSVAVTTDEGQRCEIKHPTGTNGLDGAFIAACSALARANGLSPAPTTEDTTNG